MKKLLITFGCSWTKGVGTGYIPGMSKTEYQEKRLNEDVAEKYSFRSLICKKYNFDNLNFAIGGSSNQFQFLKAEQYFSSRLFEIHRQTYDKIVVLWGITSIFRNIKFIQYDPMEIRSYMVKEKYELLNLDKDFEQYLLQSKIVFWNKFFKTIGIKNLWFDTFNNHKYDYNPIDSNVDIQPDRYEQVKGSDWPDYCDISNTNISDKILEEIRKFFPFIDLVNRSIDNFMTFDTKFDKDLLSQLSGFNSQTYHLSQTYDSKSKEDDNRISILAKKGMVNPFSFHPTAETHRIIAKMMEPYFE